jgi:type II secretory pathway component PulC
MKQGGISKSQKRLFLLLGIVAAYAAYDLSTAKARPARTERESIPAETKTGAQIETVVNTQAQTVFPSYDWRRDPFRKNLIEKVVVHTIPSAPSDYAPGNAHLHLTAISLSGARSYALINDQILSVGESVNGYKVTEIQSAKVVLNKNGYSFTLTLPEDQND